MGQYQFKEAGTMVVRNTGTGFRQITAENLNKGDNAEYVLKRHKHLIEENPQFQAEPVAAKVATAEQVEAPVKAPKQGKKRHKK